MSSQGHERNEGEERVCLRREGERGAVLRKVEMTGEYLDEQKEGEEKRREDSSRVTGAIMDTSRESWLCWLCDACAQLMTSLCLNLLSRCVYSHHTLPRVSKSCYVQEFLLHSGVCILG